LFNPLFTLHIVYTSRLSTFQNRKAELLLIVISTISMHQNRRFCCCLKGVRGDQMLLISHRHRAEAPMPGPWDASAVPGVHCGPGGGAPSVPQLWVPFPRFPRAAGTPSNLPAQEPSPAQLNARCPVAIKLQKCVSANDLFGEYNMDMSILQKAKYGYVQVA
jgi:hypothetical protein